MKTIWQTTNQQPWVEALVRGLITCKTRTTWIPAKPGDIVFLHASKSRLWPFWRDLWWVDKIDIENVVRGAIVATACVDEVGFTNDIMGKRELKFWDMPYWNCAADCCIRFKDIKPLKPIYVRGFQTPYVKAPAATVGLVRKQIRLAA